MIANLRDLCCLLFVVLSIVLSQAQANNLDTLKAHRWHSGGKDCANAETQAIEVFQYDSRSFILRQSLCSSYEAPFMYLLLGDNKALLIDTGAETNEKEFPLYTTVKDLLPASHQKLPLLVVHTHSHRDHTGADRQFEHQEFVTVIAASTKAMRTYFGFTAWPEGEAEIQLGNRTLLVIPTPGHQKDALAFYDTNNQWLLTGDTFYPGRLVIKDWPSFRQSIKRIAQLTQDYPVAAVLGSHIEMSREPGKLFPSGSQYHPNEASLVLQAEDVIFLQQELEKLGKRGKRVSFEKFSLYPLTPMQKLMINTLKGLGF